MDAMARPSKSANRNPRYAAVAILRRLQEYGHVAYFAGGCVRDALLGLEPKDYDIATDAKPDRVRLLFPKSRYVGEAFGVVRVHSMGFDIEVATFRVEWAYEDGRHPSKVAFADAQRDAMRRDFSINGLFQNPLAANRHERIIDYVGGRGDLEAKLIRAIGNPRERFAEDYLRLLRAVRFAARLGFALEPRTAEAIPPVAEKLNLISRERIGQEVLAMFAVADSTRRTQAAQLMQELHLDAPTLAEDHVAPSLPTLAALPPHAAYGTVLAAWLIDRHLPDSQDIDFAGDAVEATGRRWRTALCLSNEHHEHLFGVLHGLSQIVSWDQMPVAGRKRLLALPLWPQMRILLEALRHKPIMDGVAKSAARDVPTLMAQGVAPPPWVGGDDLIAMGRKPGPDFRRLLDAVYDAQLEGRLRNRNEALHWLEQYDQPPDNGPA